MELPPEPVQTFFRETLLKWYDPEARPLPWKEERDPYLIWLSEIILQQTRVAQGKPYFERFKSRYPDIQALAAASEDEVMKLWEGLGYYRRARHLREAARQVVEDGGGNFPDTYSGIRALKGVGPYTAAAIASFAYDLPHAVVDGNVYRVLARFFGIELPVDSAAGKAFFQSLAEKLLDRDRPGLYNQAIMDFGATLCRPRSPLCAECPLSSACVAHGASRQHALPVKRPPAPKKERWFHYLDLRYDDFMFVRKRRGDDIWRDLYELPLVEWPEKGVDADTLFRSEAFRSWLGHSQYALRSILPSRKQVLSHQVIRAVFYRLELEEPPRPVHSGLEKVAPESLGRFAFPRLVDCYLRDNSLSLRL